MSVNRIGSVNISTVEVKEDMITTLDITLSKIMTPEVFRHTPFEHETTTDIGAFLTTAGTTIVATQQHTTNGVAVVPVHVDR